MDTRRLILALGSGCLLFVCVVAVVILALSVASFRQTSEESLSPTSPPGAEQTQEVVPTLTPVTLSDDGEIDLVPGPLTGLYQQINPGVVNIQVIVNRGGLEGSGAGSGFILDESGHIVTNNHVVAGATEVTVIFYDGIQAEAEMVGTDPDSDLAVIRVDELTEGARPLSLGDSDRVQVGQWVVAIGNPFQLGGTMTLGIVSATGRAIPSGATPFNIPQAIQTDAAINPGNSGGPLLNLEGQVIGVNAQIATGGAAANAGVGFAIPANVVRRVTPVLIEQGGYQWPWLGIEGTSVNLIIQRANDLPSQQGAYIDRVVPDSPAAEAGLQGSTSLAPVNGEEVPAGGDVVIEADGEPVRDFDDLLVRIAFKQPGDVIDLVVLREGQQRPISVELVPRPTDFER